jgi:peptide chain release factor
MSDVKQTRRLLVTSGDGPRECRRAIALCIAAMEKESWSLGVEFDATFDDDMRDDPASALITVGGEQAAMFTKNWIGTIKWTCQSPFRPSHKRQNWFIGIFQLTAGEINADHVEECDIRYETFRAGGPGGQHQNTTNSAVRATHIPSGLSVVSREQRSQHRNKETARNRLLAKILFEALSKEGATKADENQLHKQLERGNPIRCFIGSRFIES